ncbi:24095_t:CDS:1, partial [Gigaspora rosea]
FWKELTHRLELIKGLVKKFKDSECELHVKECCHHCIAENLENLQKLCCSFILEISWSK